MKNQNINNYGVAVLVVTFYLLQNVSNSVYTSGLVYMSPTNYQHFDIFLFVTSMQVLFSGM